MLWVCHIAKVLRKQDTRRHSAEADLVKKRCAVSTSRAGGSNKHMQRISSLVACSRNLKQACFESPRSNTLKLKLQAVQKVMLCHKGRKVLCLCLLGKQGLDLKYFQYVNWLTRALIKLTALFGAFLCTTASTWSQDSSNSSRYTSQQVSRSVRKVIPVACAVLCARVIQDWGLSVPFGLMATYSKSLEQKMYTCRAPPHRQGEASRSSAQWLLVVLELGLP